MSKAFLHFSLPFTSSTAFSHELSPPGEHSSTFRHEKSALEICSSLSDNLTVQEYFFSLDPRATDLSVELNVKTGMLLGRIRWAICTGLLVPNNSWSQRHRDGTAGRKCPQEVLNLYPAKKNYPQLRNRQKDEYESFSALVKHCLTSLLQTDLTL